MNGIEQKHRRTVLVMGIALILCVLASFTLGRYPVSLPDGLLMSGHFCKQGYFEPRMKIQFICRKNAEN